MNQPSAAEQSSNDLKALPSEPETNAKAELLYTSTAHQMLTLIGLSFFLFEVVFVVFYSDNFWFSLNIAWLGVPAIFCAALVAHLILLGLESNFVCKLVSFVLRGRPLVVYRRWLKIDASGLTFGRRHLLWSVIDELSLTYMGNLEIKSRALCGDASEDRDLLLKIPFGLAYQSEQTKFLSAARLNCPCLVVNKRLESRINSPIVKGQNAIQLFGAVFMALILLDVGQSSFAYLEMLKHYYLSEAAALENRIKDGNAELQNADYMQAHPFPISYVGPRFLSMGTSSSGLLETRSRVLWALGRKDEAIADQHKAIKSSPENFRLYLRLARLLDDQSDRPNSRAAIAKAIEKHKDSLLPRLYMMASAHGSKPQARAAYVQAMDDFAESTFKTDPVWPPGGNSFLHDVFYSEDIYFVLNRLLGVSLEPTPGQATSGQASTRQPSPEQGK